MASNIPLHTNILQHYHIHTYIYIYIHTSTANFISTSYNRFLSCEPQTSYSSYLPYQATFPPSPRPTAAPVLFPQPTQKPTMSPTSACTKWNTPMATTETTSNKLYYAAPGAITSTYYYAKANESVPQMSFVVLTVYKTSACSAGKRETQIMID